MSERPKTEVPPTILCDSVDKIIQGIRRELKLSGMTHAELAVHLGVSHATASRFLNGRAPLSLEQLYKVLSLLGIWVVLAPPKDPALDPSEPEVKRKTPVDLGVTLQKLFNVGKIRAGDILTPVPGDHGVIAEVGLRGDLILEDGSEYTSPSAAAKAVRGTTTNGWTFWALDGRSLDSMRKELLAGK